LENICMERLLRSSGIARRDCAHCRVEMLESAVKRHRLIDHVQRRANAQPDILDDREDEGHPGSTIEQEMEVEVIFEDVTPVARRLHPIGATLKSLDVGLIHRLGGATDEQPLERKA